jgi:hypothetical protein
MREWFGARRIDPHPLLAGDAGAEPVLRELANDPLDHVQAFGTIGLRRIEEKRQAARIGG